MLPHGLFRITCAAPWTAVGNPPENVRATLAVVDDHLTSDLILLPELGITGYTCGDLFASDTLIKAAETAVMEVVEHSADHDAIVVVGFPLRVDSALMNVAGIIRGGSLHGIVPKSFLPNYREFYERRHFQAASSSDPDTVSVDGTSVPFGTRLLFCRGEARIAAELCEDLWTPIPPSSRAALAGANVLVNLSASHETIGKARWRRDLIRSQSGRCIAAYAYASAGAGESSSDLVFGGHCMVAENGDLIAESTRVGDGQELVFGESTSLTVEVDLQRLAHDRQVIGTFGASRGSAGDDAFTRIDLSAPTKRFGFRPHDSSAPATEVPPSRAVDAHPFVPSRPDSLDRRCREILQLQTVGLARRLLQLPREAPLVIGVSGGLDSTLALLVGLRACRVTGRPTAAIHGITMPGFGTTAHTRASADRLMELTGVTSRCIDIRDQCLATFRSMNHSPLGIPIAASTTVDALQASLLDTPDDATDLVFENVQARIRTLLLMSHGFVIGTGDMSEQALGWCTYNADHISMYNVNTSIPKTLVRFLVRHVARLAANDDQDLHDLLIRVAETPVSPELLPPGRSGEIRQSTEAVVGPYELHDFFLYHFVRNGYSAAKIRFLASHAEFEQAYSEETIESTLNLFLKRFFANQFKRNCVPDGPKVGSVSLSPRGDWRMPSDAADDAFVQ